MPSIRVDAICNICTIYTTVKEWDGSLIQIVSVVAAAFRTRVLVITGWKHVRSFLYFSFLFLFREVSFFLMSMVVVVVVGGGGGWGWMW